MTKLLEAIPHAGRQLISFQRKMSDRDQTRLRDKQIAFVANLQLDAADQAELAQIAGLGAMVTISTTSAHGAAALGVPTTVLVAKRPGHQWWWRL